MPWKRPVELAFASSRGREEAIPLVLRVGTRPTPAEGRRERGTPLPSASSRAQFGGGEAPPRSTAAAEREVQMASSPPASGCGPTSTLPTRGETAHASGVLRRDVPHDLAASYQRDRQDVCRASQVHRLPHPLPRFKPDPAAWGPPGSSGRLPQTTL
jgi:hypothetical protein